MSASIAVLILVCMNAAGLAVDARAAGCPNEQIRLQEGFASTLPECRAYEQVSPTDKSLADARGGAEVVHSSPSGERVTFSSIVPFPGVSGSDRYPVYLSTRSQGTWATQGLLPPSSVDCYCSIILGWTEDLTETIVHSAEFLAPGANPAAHNEYLRSSATGEYRLLVPGPSEAHFADATTDDSRILFEDEAQLLPGASVGVPNLYEWHDGTLILVAADAAAGPQGGARTESYTQNTISQDGSRVFFTDLASGQVHMREHAGGPQVRTVEVSAGPAQWRGATPDGSEVVYTEDEALYLFNTESEARTQLASGVIGTLGISESGAYVYFADNGGALYLWHGGIVTFIAPLSLSFDANNWLTRCTCGGGGNSSGSKSSRVTAPGTTLLFSSTEPLTGYDNEDEHSHEKYYELYLYDAPTGELTCVSCNPTGARPTNLAYLVTNTVLEGGTVSVNTPVLTRNLSSDGNRVFFETEEALLPHDENGKMDVYEWERKGSGGCADSSGGCLYLISTGTSTSPSYFGDASAEGSDVFFFTRQSLVGQDQDYNSDIYDARVGGGTAAQNMVALPCASENACHGAASSPPVFGAPSSATFAGAGNLPPQTSAKAVTKPKPLTQAQKLASALRICKKRPKRQRPACNAQARKRYGAKPKATKSYGRPK
jgi:hypothetical protein